MKVKVLQSLGDEIEVAGEFDRLIFSFDKVMEAFHNHNGIVGKR